MGEPSISCGPITEGETYRFVWLRTFHRSIAVRISRSGGGARLLMIELTGSGGYDPGAVARRVESTLSDGDWQALMAGLGQIRFWEMPTQLTSLELGLDGAQWIIEGRRGSEYHVVDRWSPREGPYREAALSFLKLAGVPFAGKDLY